MYNSDKKWVERINKYLNNPQVKSWVLSHSESLPDYDQFCDGFIANIMNPIRKRWEDQFYIHKAESAEIRFFLDLSFNFLESHTYRNIGGNVITKRCPIAFPSF